MSLAPITSWLTRKIGLEPDTVGPETVQRAIRGRMAECGLSDAEADAYFVKLQSSMDERQRLIEELVVPETWFFRDWGPFVFLEHYVAAEWLPRAPRRRLRALSVPCATGEEAYSIAMSFMNVGLDPAMFHIDAVDISRNALEKCRRAVYRKASFRGDRLDFVGRYFEDTSEGKKVIPAVRDAVHFAQANVLDFRFPLERSPYDIVFCRNLLIYFDETARKRAVRVLDQLLDDRGVLFAGHAENLFVLGPGFSPVRHARAFAFRKAEEPRELPPRRPRRAPRAAESPLGNPAEDAPRPSRTCGTEGTRRSPRAADALHVQTRPAPTHNVDEKTDVRASLERARRLADAGKLDQSIALCEELIARRNASAETYCLLGLLNEAAGETARAEECLNKALYVDPRHYEALVHLMLLLESRGDAAPAAALRRRAERARDSRRNLNQPEGPPHER